MRCLLYFTVKMSIATDIEKAAIRGGSVIQTDHGLIEISISKSTVTWVNDFIKQKCAKESRTIIGVSLYGLIDESYRAKLSFVLNSLEGETHYRKTVWPVCNASKIRWWSVELVKMFDDLIYAVCIPLVLTETTGPTYEFASLMSGVVENNSVTASTAISSVASLTEEISILRSEIEATRLNILAAVKASEEAARLTEENKKSIEVLRESVSDQLTNQTNDISALVTSNAVHDKRMSIFEEHVKKTTTDAIREISDQADVSKQVLSKNFTVPVTLTGIIVAIVQYIISHWKLPG
jgi:hypothetical protein